MYWNTAAWSVRAVRALLLTTMKSGAFTLACDRAAKSGSSPIWLARSKRWPMRSR